MRTCRKLLIYSVSFIVCFCTSIAIDLACGPEIDPYDYYVSFFHNNIQAKKEYQPFFYNANIFVYEDENAVSIYDINAEEWSAHLGKDVSTSDVKTAMYDLTPAVDSVLLNGYLKNGEKLPEAVAGNTFLKALQIKKNPTAVKYYRFAKSVEKLANVAVDHWNPAPLDSAGLRAAGNLAFKNALIERDKFIQLRYYYQAQRLLHYGGAYKEASKIYDKYIAFTQSKSHVKGWAMALKAGELSRMNDTIQAAYLFSKVFVQYPEKRVMAYQNYKYINPSAAHVLTLATNNNEKAIIYAIDNFGNTALNFQSLEKVYDYQPTSPLVGLLLVREINKIEEQYLTDKLASKNRLLPNRYYPTDEDKNSEFLKYINKLRAFCKLLATEHKYPDYNIGNLAGAYLSWIQGDNAGGSAYIRAMANETLSPALNDQKQIIQLLLSAQSIQKLNEVNEASLLPLLRWLQTKAMAEVKKEDNGSYSPIVNDPKFNITANNFYEEILVPAYLKQNDTTKAALALLKSTKTLPKNSFWINNLHSNQVARIIRYKKTPSAVPYLNFLTEELKQIDINYLYDLQGTAYLREHQYAKAITIFKLVSPTYLSKQTDDYDLADPFIERINDYPRVYRYGKTKGLNKLQFAIAMNDIEQKIKTDAENAPSYYYRYATGLYNTSYYGNASYLISYSWSGGDFGRPDQYSYDADYMRTKNAEKYFVLASNLSSNPEFKAKCVFMAAKCRQKEFIMPNYGSPNYEKAEKDYMLDLRSNDYFYQLKGTYKKTDFFKKAVGECSYLKDFMLTEK